MHPFHPVHSSNVLNVTHPSYCLPIASGRGVGCPLSKLSAVCADGQNGQVPRIHKAGVWQCSHGEGESKHAGQNRGEVPLNFHYLTCCPASSLLFKSRCCPLYCHPCDSCAGLLVQLVLHAHHCPFPCPGALERELRLKHDIRGATRRQDGECTCLLEVVLAYDCTFVNVGMPKRRFYMRGQVTCGCQCLA